MPRKTIDHGHTDDADLRDALSAVMRDEGDLPLAEGAFLQLIEFHAGHPERFQALAEEWRERIGSDATAQWAVVAADRDRPGFCNLDVRTLLRM